MQLGRDRLVAVQLGVAPRDGLGNDLGIQPVGLASVAQRDRVVVHVRRVQDVHHEAALVRQAGQQFLVTPRRLHRDHAAGRQTLEPTDDARSVVGHDPGHDCALVAGHLQLELTDIDPNKAARYLHDGSPCDTFSPLG
ncbi:hypothetical protein AYO32_10930 [Streptococcus pneumoniae]|nr:hypothetical protein AYO32_10930 [Streptococcus pneumoniae]